MLEKPFWAGVFNVEAKCFRNELKQNTVQKNSSLTSSPCLELFTSDFNFK